MFKFCDTLIGHDDLGFTKTEGSSILVDGFPTNWPPCPDNHISGYTAIFKQVKRG
jgi:hypothetical protein